MSLRRQTLYSVLSTVWYFTGGNQQDETFNIFLFLKELVPYSKSGIGVGWQYRTVLATKR